MKSLFLILMTAFTSIAYAGGAEVRAVFDSFKIYRVYQCDLTPNTRYKVFIQEIDRGYQEEGPKVSERFLDITDSDKQGCAETTFKIGVSSHFGDRTFIFRSSEGQILTTITE
jgi:hypothetical protein